MTRSEFEVTLKREKESHKLSIFLDLKPPPCAVNVTVNPSGILLAVQKVDGRRGNMREHVVRFLESMGAHLTIGI